MKEVDYNNVYKAICDAKRIIRKEPPDASLAEAVTALTVAMKRVSSYYLEREAYGDVLRCQRDAQLE